MANNENLRPIRDSKVARELQEKSVRKRRENIEKRKTLKEELLALLTTGNIQESITLALLEKAKNGDTKAYEIIRDTVGEKPVEKLEAEVKETTINISLEEED